MKYKRLLRLTVAVIALCGMLIGALASTGLASLQPLEGSSRSYVPTLTHEGAAVPDWTQITWGNLPPVQESGSLNVSPDWLGQIGYDPSRSWQQGQTPDRYMLLGDIQESFHPEYLSLDLINQLSKKKLDLKKVALSAAPGIASQSVDELVKAIPGLESFPLKEVRPVMEALIGGGNRHIAGQATKLVTRRIGDLLQENPELGKYVLKQHLQLQKYNLASIPGLKDTPIGKFAGWQELKIAEVPGLNAIPLNGFPTSPFSKVGGAVGKIDVVYGPNESNSTYKVITGSDKEGFNVPCVQPHCAYLELSDPLGDKGPLHGARWIKGGKPEKGGQMVKGGHGILGQMNGGKEPTGRLPFGPSMKLVLKETAESSGRADLAFYLRACSDLGGCTPFMFGPIPFVSLHEKSPILVGLNAPVGPPPDIDVPDWIRNKIDQIEDAYSGEGGEGGLGGDCADAVMRQVPPSMIGSAKSTVPLILDEAQKAKLTPAQTAYVLATAQHESNMGMHMRELGVSASAYGGFPGKGLVQLTWRDNYEYWSKRLKIDLISNPDEAANPKTAAKILVGGMKDGTFTGVRMDRYINSSQIDYIGARRVVNGTDRAALISRHASNYYRVLKKGCSGSGKGSGKLRRPTGGPVTSEFGPRSSPCAGCSSMHKGIDLGIPNGTPVKAADGGVVTYAGWASGYGNTVIIDHGNGRSTRYAHLDSFKSKVGQKVSSNQAVAISDSTGVGTGAHLHFEVREGTAKGNPFSGNAVNPRKYVNF